MSTPAAAAIETLIAESSEHLRATLERRRYGRPLQSDRPLYTRLGALRDALDAVNAAEAAQTEEAP